MISKRLQHAPYPAAPKKYCTAAQEPIKIDDSKQESPEGINRIQKIVLSILYYSGSVDTTILMALSTLASEKSKATVQTIKDTRQLLHYLGTHPDTTL